MQFRRRLDHIYPYCRIANHTEAEVGEILATLEAVYREPFEHLNLRQFAGIIYSWLTEPTFDPTNSGRVIMRDLMMLVTSALQRSYQAGETEVSAETLQAAVPLLKENRSLTD